MATNRYRRHLERRHYDNTGLVRSTAKFVGKAALIGGAIYGAGRGLKYISGLDKFASTIKAASDITSLTRGTLRGIHQTAISEGFLHTLSGQATEALSRNIDDSLASFYKGTTRKLGGGLTRTESLLENIYDLKAAMPGVFRKEMRRDFVIDTLRKRLTEDGVNVARTRRVIDLYRFDKRYHGLGVGLKDELREDVIEGAVRKIMDEAGPHRGGGLDFLKGTLGRAMDDAAKRTFKEFTPGMTTLEKADFFDANEITKRVQNLLRTSRKGRQQFGTIVRQTKATLGMKSENFGFIERVFSFMGYDKLTVGRAMQEGLIDNASEVMRMPGRGRNIPTGGYAAEVMDYLKDEALDPLIFAKGKHIIDMREIAGGLKASWDSVARNVHVPILGFKPMDLLPIMRKTSMADRPFALFRMGSNIPGFSKSGSRLTRDYFYYGGSTFTTGGRRIGNDFTLESARTGRYAKTAGNMMGEMGEEIGTDGLFNKFKRFTDIGTQGPTSGVGRFWSRLSKFRNKEYAPKILRALKAGELTYDEIPGAYKTMLQTVENQTTPLTTASLDLLSGQHMAPEIRQALEFLRAGPTATNVTNALDTLVNSRVSSITNKSEMRYILENYRTYRTSIDEAMKTITTGSRKGTTYTRLDEARKAVETAVISHIEGEGHSVGRFVTDAISEGKLRQFEGDDIMDLMLYGHMKGMGTGGSFGGITERGRLQFSGIITGDGAMLKRLQTMVGLDNPRTATFGAKGFVSPFTERFMPVRKMQGFKNSSSQVREILTTVNQTLRQGFNAGDSAGNIIDSMYDAAVDSSRGFGKTLWKEAKSTFNEMGFGSFGRRAGRFNQKDMTRLTHDTYFIFSRLNDIYLNQFSIGLNPKHIPDAQTLAMRLLGKRIAGPLALMTAAKYVDFEIGEATGEKPSDIAVQTHANISMGVAGFKQITGLNRFGKRFNQIRPGFQRLFENPVGVIAKIGTFGFLGETRSKKELYKHYTEGYNEVRKGRYWGFGSTTPMYGGRISHFDPSYYRTKMGAPQFTDSLWGSEKEYWANHWMPNLRNPLGPLKTWTPLGAYHYDQNKYFKGAITGPIPELEALPLVGPMLSATIGRVLKPTFKAPGLRKAHRKYISEINQAYSNLYREQYNAIGGMVSGAGTITPLTNVPGYGSEAYYAQGGIQGYAHRGAIATGGYGGATEPGATGYGGIPRSYGIGRGAQSTYSTLSGVNRGLASGVGQGTSGVREMTDPRRRELLKDNLAITRLGQAANPHSIGYALGKTVYSGTELAGIYGFMAMTLMGGDIAPEVALQSGERMYGYERRFWEQNLGGFGGGLSEVYRRFLPHRRRQITQYNPIRNAMPGWLPSQTDYFIDFQHGIPMIDKYYQRLPGPGYESINKLHPDSFGRYGALDRMKILGDVAPWSEQYHYYSKMATKMHTSGVISDLDYESAIETRERVSRVKEKYDFFPDKFRHIKGKLKRQRLTITRQIDPVTFMTKEHPSHPIRLAGIRLPSKSSPQYQQVVQDLGKLITVGDVVTAEIATDPLKFYRDDTMRTISVAIQDKLGQPVARTLARRYSDIKVDWETTDPVAVASLFSKQERGRGARWEYLSHMATPINTKLMQARTPLEHYERNFVYGKNWRSWGKPVKSWIVPTLNTWAARNPVGAAGRGAILGAMLGGAGIFGGLKLKHTAKYGAIIGGLTAAALATLRTTKEIVARPFVKNSTWIPGRRRKERRIDEYFDKLKYVKYSGLYQKARSLSIAYHGIDPQMILDDIDEQAAMNSSTRRKFRAIKQRILTEVGYPFKEHDRRTAELKFINTSLRARNSAMQSGKYTMLALEYYQKTKQTLYGADTHGNIQDVYAAMPQRDKMFFQQFVDAPARDREKILRLVPQNQRRFYQAKWGLQQDGRKDISGYFTTHNLPDATWEGWLPNVDLEDVKVKFLENKGLELGEFGYYKDDLRNSRKAPSISGGIFSNPFKSMDILRLKRVLAGKGIHDIDITIYTDIVDSPANLLNIKTNIKSNKYDEIREAMGDDVRSALY